MYKKCNFCGKDNFEEMTNCWNCGRDLSEIRLKIKKKIILNPPVDPKKNIDNIKSKIKN